MKTITVTFDLVGDNDAAMEAWIASALRSAKEWPGFELDDWSMDPHDGAGPR